MQRTAEHKADAALEVGQRVQDLVLAVDRMLEADGRYYSACERRRSQGDQIRAIR